jgi:hypothetical protein
MGGEKTKAMDHLGEHTQVEVNRAYTTHQQFAIIQHLAISTMTLFALSATPFISG